MEMKLLDSFGPIDDNFSILLDDEYAYSAGARIVIRPLITSSEKENKYLEATHGHFDKFVFNPKTNQFITCEVSYHTILNIKVYLYNKAQGFTLQTETIIENCTEVTDLDITRDGSRLCIMLAEPHLCLKIYEITTETADESNEEEEEDPINEEKGLILKEILSIPLIVNSYKKCRFNPLKKNFIFMLSQRVGTLIEILDAFPDGYQPMESDEEIPLEHIKSNEEKQLIKRFEVYHLDANQNLDDYIDFCWARYNQIYISYSSGEVYLYDLIKRMQNIRDKRDPIEDKEPDRIEDLSNTVHAMFLTQRYLICAQENGKIALVNMYLSDSDFKECRSSLGGVDMYRMFHVENELEVTKMVQTNEYITSMKYNNDYQKILAKTNFNNLYCLVLKAEILITNQEAQTDTDNTVKEIYNFEELKFHDRKIFGVRGLGETSEAISISEEDKRIIFWDVGKKLATTSTVVEFTPTCFETNPDGNLIFIASTGGTFRIYDITRRASINLIYQMKFNYKSSDIINRIIVHPLMKFVVLFKQGDRYIYFISGEVSKKFAFIGYIKVPTAIIDININNVQGEDFSTDPVTIGSIVVLVKGMMLLYNISQFFYDHKECWDIRKEKVEDVFSRFELKVEPKGRKVDGDLNLMLKNCTTKPQTHIWLCGTDNTFRIFPLPVDKFEIVKESKKPIETPEEIKAHDLDVVCGNVYDDNIVITVGKDGVVQYRKDKKLIKKFRTHSFANGGISSFYYSEKRRLIFTSGYDGSICILGTDDDVELPSSEILPELMSPMDSLESVDFLSDELCKNFPEYVNDQHQALIRTSKRQNQGELISKLDEIKNDQAKLFLDNSKLETHEQLKDEEMIIDKDKIQYEETKNIEISNELNKKRFKELCEKEMIRTVLLDNTYNIMKESNDDANINNNLRLAYNSNGSRELKSFPIPNFSERTKDHINFAKQLRLPQKMEEYKNRNEGIAEIIPEKALSVSPEDYIVNRLASIPIIVEKEVILVKNGQEEGISKEIILDDKTLGNIAKYKLQRNPYEEVNKKGDGDGGDMGIKGPEEQIYKEDRQLEYRTMLEINKNIPDVEFKSDLNQISSFSLLYSPFELYTNNRIKTQIYLLIDAIHQLKKNFNNDFATYITERNQVLEKFNTNKSAIEAIREILVDIPIPEYSHAFNKHEDNEWIEKFSTKEVQVPKYFSQEEKKKLEEERKAEEERLKALQGDTLQMRGLHHMIDNRVKNNKKNQNEEVESVREPWMNKKKEEMTEEQLKIFLEFQRKEIEIREQKEKIRSQNLTKLNFHKSEIENNLMDLDMKFAKILRRKLHYDTLIGEEEIYILSLIKLLQKRQEVEKTKRKIEKEKKSAEEQEIKLGQRKNEFRNCLNVSQSPQAQEEEKKNNPREDDKKNNYKDEIKNLFTILDPKRNEAYLKSIRSDPFYFDEREHLEHLGKYGDKEYDEIPNTVIKQFNQNQRQSQQQRNTQIQQEKAVAYFNRKYYFDYKKKQYEKHYIHLNNEFEQIEYKSKQLQQYYRQLENEMDKIKLNFNIMIRCKRGQDEVTDDKFIIPTEKEFRLESSPNNELLQEMNQEEQQQLTIQEPPDKYTLGVPLENSFLVDCTDIDGKNEKLQFKFNEKIDKQNLNKKQMQEKLYLTLENSLLQVSTSDIELKMKYLKLTRVTKKIQEIVTGKEEINQLQIAKLYEDKKKNLEENTNKRLEALENKHKEIVNDIEKKTIENTQFAIKLERLKEDVGKTRQILDLGMKANENIGDDDDFEDERAVPDNKTFEIAEVSKLKSQVKNYYEEIEYLRAELDKLRARTFPSFLQKPDNVIYPDEK